MQEYESFNQTFIQIALADELPFAKKLYIDYARHNGLYEYSTMTLACWAHLTLKKSFKPEEAMVILNFTMAPLYIIFAN